MAIINPEVGFDKKFAAGATREVISLRSEETSWVIGDRRIAKSPGVVAIWHEGSAGTWRGLKNPRDLQTMKPNEAPEMRLEKAVVNCSRSGGGDGCAAVLRVPEEGIAIVTSGYKGRGHWWVVVLDAQGNEVYNGPTIDYRAKFAQPETF